MIDLSDRSTRALRRVAFDGTFGASCPIGAPFSTRALLIADVFAEQSIVENERETFGAELGLRYQVTERIVVDAGAGSEIAGPADRSRFFFLTGAEFAF